MEYEIVKYSPEFRTQVLEIQKHLWGPDPALNSAYLEWKYERNPYMDTPLIYLALCAGRVVGMRGLCGARWEMGGRSQTFLVLCTCDFVIAPEHRNKSLVTQMVRAMLDDLADRGHAYVFSLSAGPVTIVGSLAMGWRSIGSLQAMQWPAQSSAPLRQRVRGRMRGLPFIWRYADRLPSLSSLRGRQHFHALDRNAARQRKASPHVVLERTPRPEAMSQLVERIGSDGRIRHVRDQQYFVWRYRNPGSFCRFLFWEDARLEGYLVLETSALGLEDQPRANIVDWEATNEQVRADLLRAATQWGNFPELMIWSATLPDEARTLLRSSGFRPYVEAGKAPYHSCVLVRSVRDEMLESDWVLAGRRLLDLSNWDLRLLYSL